MSEPLVVQITEAFTGGVERHLELLSRTLPSRGWRTHCIVSFRRDAAARETAARITAAGGGVDEIPMPHGLCLGPDLLAYARLKRSLRRLRPALVHTHAAKGGLLGRRAAYELGLPCVHTPHVLPFERAVAPWLRGLYARAERLMLPWCDRLICLTPTQMDHALEARLGPVERLAVIPNGVDAGTYAPASAEARREARRSFRIPPGAPVVGTAGRLVRQQRLGRVLPTAARVRERVPGVRWLVAGAGAEAGACRHEAARLGLQQCVLFPGRVREMRSFYAAIDAFLLASLWEGLPYVLLETQAAGVPVIATPTDGAVSLIEDGETGWIRPPEPAALAEAVVDALKGGAETLRRVSWGRERVARHFRLAEWADAHAALYSAVLAGAP